jgi:glycosyltransferase involved in cell wall biosynthesis
MPGNVPYGRVTQYFRAADIGVVPLTATKIKQQNGALASKLWDYMAAGLSVVVTDFPSTPSASLLADKAYVVPPEDPNAMAKAFADLLGSTNKRARLAEAGLNYVRQHRTWRQAAAETADFISKRLTEAP